MITSVWPTSCPLGGRKRVLPGLIVVCFGRFWVRGLPFPNARPLGAHFSGRTHFHGA
jgi:hypothetical protein